MHNRRIIGVIVMVIMQCTYTYGALACDASTDECPHKAVMPQPPAQWFACDTDMDCVASDNACQAHAVSKKYQAQASQFYKPYQLPSDKNCPPLPVICESHQCRWK